MKVFYGIVLIIMAGMLLVTATIDFFEAQAQLDQIQTLGDSFTGLMGLVIGLTDALGVTDIAEQRHQLQVAKGVAVGMGFVALLLGLAGVSVITFGMSQGSRSKSNT